MTDFAKRIANLSPDRQELLARLLEQERLDFSLTVITPRKQELEPLPLSFAQQRLWFMDQLEPQRAIYNIPDSHYFEGPLNIDALERSLSEIVRRHEGLRTTFQTIAGEPVQVIAEAQPAKLEVVDLSELPAAEREAEAERLANEEARRPFDLTRGPLLRVRLLRLSDTEHVLLMTMHHIISDGWSIKVFGRELAALYEAYSAGQRSPLRELPIQYADFAVWQREWLRGEVLEKQLKYWRAQLGGELPVLELPTDRPRPARQSYRGAMEGLELSEAVRQRLREIGRESGATPYMTLLAAFNVLLWRYSGQAEILVGTPIANRNRAETEELIGFFVNTLVMRTRMNGGMSFRELLEQVRETTLGAYEHQDMPFEKLVDELQPERSLSRQPVFQVMFTLQDVEALQLAGLELSWLQTEIKVVKFDMTLALAEGEGYLGGVIIYNTDLFDAATVKRMTRQLELLLTSIADNPQQLLSELPRLTEAEQQMLAEWNQTEREYPEQDCIHELFEAQAARTPEAVAVVFNEEQLTYRELNDRANQLAHYLRGVGVGAEVLVGVLLERSVEMVVAVLGILKAGGAFVPLNPTYPEERLRFMLDDAGLSILLTQQSLLARLPAEQRATATSLDSDWARIAELSTENLHPPVTPNNLAYVIYTSGSTGQPKGVLVQHQGVPNLAMAQAEAFEVSAESRVLQFASISFDATVSEIFKTLLAGATLCLGTGESLLPVGPLLNLLRTQAITTVTLPPSVWAVLPSDSLPALHTAISAGEPCSAEIAAAWSGNGRRFLNAYGPTEVTVCATISEGLDGSCKPPIGRAIANTEVYVLDAELRPVPIGVVGELYVGGVGLARGYLRRPALTAERFVPHPFSSQPGSRLYRTGDLGRYWTNGNLEYLGRIDQQVKVRGFRIELGEIESALAQHPAVRDVVVLAREDVPGDQRLVAYLITEPGPTVDVGQWRAWLSQKLPEYMLPAAFVLLPEFPLTANGKVDRRALPAPDASRPMQGHAYLAPRDRLEQLLVDLWQPALGLEQIGVADNFFDIGGNSIKGAILINRLQEVLGEYVYVVAIFDAPTVAELANYLRRHYPEAVNRICGFPALAPVVVTRQISAAQIAEFKQLIPALPEFHTNTTAEPKNPPAVFVLSPPRSGSTLMRVMLGGHPQLFAPPELELLSFNTLADRRREFADRFSFWLEGTLRALMQIKQCDADEAKRLMQQCEDEQLTTKQFYALLQSWLGNRLLVDKTPSYALDIEILRRAENDFAETRYIHLIRHPYAVIRSFEEARLEQVFFRHQHNFSRRELAELIWLVSQANILQFLEKIPAERQHQVHFEQLVNEPEPVLRGVCEFLGLDYVNEMATPYREQSQRMVDGIHPLSKMLGDVKFHEHTGVDAAPADRWQQQLEAGDLLAQETWTIAERLGYPVMEQHLTAPAVRRQELQPIRRVAGERVGLPLSFAQQRLWFMDQLEPQRAIYNIPDSHYFEGPLNLEALERSLSEIVRRHESLRTTFQTIAGGPVQVIAEPQAVKLDVIDLSKLPAAEGEAEAQRLGDEEARRPFDLTRGPLLRVRLVRLADTEHVLLLTMHHIISDGWSIGVLGRELTALYAAYCAGQSSPLADLPIQYADFAVWQREWLRSEVLEKQLGYWREQLGGQLPVLELPADRPRLARQSYRGAVEVLELSEELRRRLHEISRASGATPFMTLLAAFNVLLWRYSGQGEVLVGTPMANRNRAETEELIGFFVNTLVIRTRMNGGMSFRELLAQVRETTLGAYEHQDMPFEMLVEELQPERTLSRMPVFQVVFSMQNATTDQLALEGMNLDFMPTETHTTKFDLVLAATENDGTLFLSLRYTTDLFDAPRIQRMLEHFACLLEAIAADPAQRLSSLPITTERERSEVIAHWSDSRERFAVNECLHELFDAQVKRTPEAIALVCEQEQLTYRQLDQRANQLANYLRALGVGPEVLVALCLDRSPNMIVGVLAVLKAGGAYLPLEPEHPAERLAFTLADSGASILLTEGNRWKNFAGAAVKVVQLDADMDREAISRESEEPPVNGALPDNLAYVIYTSGSTGKPKGVAITHRDVTRLFAATQKWFHCDEHDVWTLFHSYAFDFSVWEIWGALLHGGRLVIVPYLVSRSPETFHELLLREKVTILNQTPSAFRQLLHVDENREAASELALRLIIFGGEALELQSLKAWFDRHGDQRPQLVNMYGITETTVHVTYRPLSKEDIAHTASSRIGMPIPDLEVYVLDRDLNPVPFGIPGELYVGGAGLARNYLNRAALTAERFVPNPFAEKPGERLYRTGDLVCLVAPGDLEYVGRIDQQVKIRGFRIELGEIEAALAAHPSLSNSVVIAREDQPGDRRLVAYLVNMNEGTDPSLDELRSFLSEKLPAHMIPAAFVLMEKLPLTVNGKVDIRALPAPGLARPALERSYLAPRNGLEIMLAEMWQELLRIEQIGVEDDFFSLGGDSIKGAIFINRLQEKLNEIVHVVTIFQYPAIAPLAAYLEEQYQAAVRRVTSAIPVAETESDKLTTSQGPAFGVTTDDSSSSAVNTINATTIAQLREFIKPLPSRNASDSQAAAGKNPPAIFVLSAPRSGSTLFRVMLNSHPKLFAPPELELLSFNTLAERRVAFSGSQSFWLEGTIRAIMELKHCGADEAKAAMQEMEERGLTTKECYRQLQDWANGRRLVDKTPSYALDRSILERAEADFAEAHYIQLVRHPYGMIRSFEEAHLEQIFFRHEHKFTRRELAELIWLVSNENILEFLRDIPRERQHQVSFEKLLAQPEETLRSVCNFLSLDFNREMLEPYQDKQRSMTDGIHAQSRMLGDVKFHQYTGVNAAVANRWREQHREDSLGDETWAIAEKLGYEPEEQTIQAPAPAGLRSIPHLTEYTGREFPLSFAQQRLWFIQQLTPESCAYNIPIALCLSGRLDVRALEQTFTEIVQRHAVLRTTFTSAVGEPVQTIAAAQPVNLAVTDLSHLPAAQREDKAQLLADEEAQQSFDLEHGPLLRARLVKLDDTEHVLLLTMHHIISDGWSVGLLEQELSALYPAFSAGKSSPLPELKIQYADFAIWQRGWLRGEVLEKQLSYWREQLAELPLLALPTDRPRPALQTYRGEVEPLELSEAVGRRLKEIGQENGVTLFMTLLAAFNVLLSRYTGQTDISIGTPIAGRNRPELEPLVGFFVNTLVLRTRFSSDADFRDLLRQVKNVTHGAFQHQDVPFEKLVDELQPPRDPSHTPLFEVMFTLADISQEKLKLPGLRVSWMEQEMHVAKFDLSLSMVEEEGFLSGSISYNTDLFEAATIQRMARHFELLLTAIAANPLQRLSDLPLLTEAEQQLLTGWNETGRAFPDHVCIHELFERQAARTPDAVALIFNEERISYRELNSRANQLAHYLRSVGVGPEVLVGILMERSVEMIVALFGTLKAGGAYVPLDPRYPAERLAFMIDDAETAVLITQTDLRDRVADAAVKKIIVTEQPIWRDESVENPSAAVSADNLAYVIYTSGSTGRPKGVAIEHHSAATLLHWAREEFKPEELQGVLASTSICFDLSVFELFVPLSWGGTVILAENALALPSLPAKAEVRLVNTVPSAINELMRMGAIPEQVRVVNLAGEALRRELVEELFEQQTIERVVNLYGPSEDTTYSTYAELKRGESGQVVIGRPIAKTRAYVVDERGMVAPIGVAGELCLGGEGLARGYLKRADLSAEKFIPDGLSGQSGARLYRTGDLTRYRADGNIEYLGRLDHQVKIRGFRIEPGEIETRLRQHEAVREALVLVEGDGQEEVARDKRLVAYVVAEPELGLTVDALRRYLREALPEHMIPSAFVLLDEMPLTPNGKINRQALPDLADSVTEQQEIFAAPRDAMEMRLQRLWEDVLNVRPVGITDNFFDLGGHSLLAVRMMAQLSSQLGRELPLVLILQKQTIERLAALLRQQVEPQTASPLVAIQPEGRKQPLFFVHPVGGSVICYSGLARHLGLEQPFYGIQIPGLDGPTEEPLTQIEAMAARYLEELRTVQSEGPYMLGGWSMGGVVAFEMAQQLRRQGQEVSLLALVDSRAPIRPGPTDVDEERLLLQFTSDISGLYGLEQSLAETTDSEPLGVEEHLGLLLQQVVGAGLLPPDFDLKQLSRRFHVFETNVRAMLGYEPQRYPGRITFFRASEPLSEFSEDTAKDWHDLAADGVEVHVVPGNHYTMLREPLVQVVAEWLKVSLDITGEQLKPAPTQTIEIASAVSL
ncbi:MAG TPA: amino acid adenylation domain-containing protein [Pyrinomonadaceae bacterium]|nr:amino acid adenylation domain-containing protein [Pyrinomonadaceae bacterium]